MDFLPQCLAPLSYVPAFVSMNLLDKFKLKKEEKPPEVPVTWIETSETLSHQYQFDAHGRLSVRFSILFLFLIFIFCLSLQFFVAVLYFIR